MRISAWSSDVCSSDLLEGLLAGKHALQPFQHRRELRLHVLHPRIVVAFEERDCRQARERQHQRARGDERASAGDDVQAVFEALELAPGCRASAACEGGAQATEGAPIGTVGLYAWKGGG